MITIQQIKSRVRRWSSVTFASALLFGMPFAPPPPPTLPPWLTPDAQKQIASVLALRANQPLKVADAFSLAAKLQRSQIPWLRLSSSDQNKLVSALDVADRIRSRPDACRTRDNANVPTYFEPPYWWFVVNFDVVDNDNNRNPQACVLSYAPGQSLGYFKTVPCKKIGNVDVRGGRAILRGGFISCHIDLHEAIEAKRYKAKALDSYNNSYLWIRATGVLSVALTRVPVVVYRPDIAPHDPMAGRTHDLI